MLINKNRKIKIIVFLLICVNVFSVNVFAQSTGSCDVCGSASDEFRYMTEFMKEMMLAIKTQGTRDPYVGKYVSPNWFKGGEFDPPKQGAVNKLAENINQKLQTIIAVSNILVSPRSIGGTDVIGGFAVLFKDDVFNREYRTLMQIDSVIADKKFELGQAGGWYDKINEENIKQFQKILDKYGSGGHGLFSSPEMKPSATYGQIMNIVSKMNSSLKFFISLNMISQFNADSKKAYIDNHGINISYNNSSIIDMQSDYSCVRGVSACDANTNKLSDNIKKITVSFASGAKDSWKLITDSVDRLKSKQDFKERQDILIENMYGLNADKIQAGGFLGMKNYRNMLSEAKSQITGFISHLTGDFLEDNNFVGMFSGNGVTYAQRKETMKGVREEIDKLREVKGKTKESDLTNDELVYINILFSLENKDYDISDYDDMRSNVQKIINEASNKNTNALIGNNTDVTYAFKGMFDTINLIINDVIGSRNKDGTLIKNLGEACKAQCGNGGKCFY